jgi:hypothetical protein
MRVIRADVSFEGTDEILTISGLKSDVLMAAIVEDTARRLNDDGRYQESDEVRKSLTRTPMTPDFK